VPAPLTWWTALAVVLAASGQASTPPLVGTAWYWEARRRDDRAAEAWQQVLRSGDRPDALAAVGARLARAGRLGEARTYLARLTRRWSGSPEQAQLEQAITIGSRYGALLARARDAARAGRLEDAVNRYQELFGPAPPPGHLAAEYYEVLAGVPRMLPEAVAGLEELVRRVPRYPRYRLSLARALTYAPATRAEGVSRLEELEDHPAVGAGAGAAGRRARPGLPPGAEAEAHLARWLARHPSDREIADLQAQRQESAGVENGYEALRRGDLSRARRGFAEAGNDDPRALAGLAVIALRKRDYGTARLLAERARDLAPGDPSTWEEPLRAARFWDLVSRGRAETAAGRYDEARALLAEAAAQPAGDVLEAELALTELDEARGARPEAEARLRTLAAAHPSDAAVLRRLVEVLVRSGKHAEALRFDQQLARAHPGAALDPRPLRVAAQRDLATQLRDRGDLTAARRTLLAAHEIDPSDAWVIHDLADLALGRGDLAEARRFSQTLAALAPDLPAARALQARLLAASGERERALAAIDAIPPDARDASLDALRRRIEVEAGVAQALALPAGAARERLQRLESSAGADPDLLAAIARAWRHAGDFRQATRLFRDALRSSNGAVPALRLELAAALVERGGADQEATETLDGLRAEARLTPAQRRAVRDLSAGLAVRRADALREGGDTAAALRLLGPALDDAPDDARLLAARGRVLLAAGDAEEALATFRRALACDPDALDARDGAVAASLARGRRDEARRLAAEGVARAAGGAPAEGGKGQHAGRALRSALAVRQDAPPPEELTTAARAELDRISARHALEAVGGFVARSRDGVSGLGALSELRFPVSSALPIGFTGRLILEATPVRLDAGEAGPGQADLATSFGSGAAPAGSVGARGLELQARWEQRLLSLDVGTTPVGFPLRSFTGGLRLSGSLGPLDAVLTVSRRAVTDSVLSYAGMRDPATGQVWGGVVRNEARLALSWRDARAARWVTAAAAALGGTGVAPNTEFQVSGGANWIVGHLLGGDARAGFALTALSYARNQRFFTTGQGGYFSPQALVHAGVPLSVRGGSRLAWEVTAEPGANWFREDGVRGAGGSEDFPGRRSLGVALDLRSRVSWALSGGLETALELEGHEAQDYQELRISLGLSWRLWSPR
jgi:predicted Zn-dependent protease